MGEISNLVNRKAPAALNVIQYPVGTWGFVGAVPAVLAYNCDDAELLDTAARFGAGIAAKIAKRERKVFETCTWETKELALAAAVASGHNVANG